MDSDTKFYLMGNNWTEMTEFVKLFELLHRATTKCSGAYNSQYWAWV
jgi:hypothetical protein